MIYLDNSATTRQYDEVTELMYRAAKDNFGNPSSLHALGFEAGNLLYDARRQVEALLPPAGNTIFTSGGTEGDNMALISAAHKLRRRGNRILTTKVEHPAVLETCKRLADEGFEIEYLDVDVDGYVEEQAVKAAIDDNTIIVSIMTVNNEVGTIEPVFPVSRMIREYNRQHGTEIIFHTDAVQAFGKLPMDTVDADIIVASGHKFHGPKGTGLVYIKKRHKLPPFITGGGQEGGLRSSTENTPGIAGLGLAAEISANDMMMKISRMGIVNNYLLNGLRTEISDIIVNGPEELGYTLQDHGRRCPTVLNVTFEGTRGEVLLHTLEQDGIYVSTGSACSSHKTGDSHVLSAMSMTHKEIEGAIRFSFSEFNTVEEMDAVIARTKTAVERFRRLGSFR